MYRFNKGCKIQHRQSACRGNFNLKLAFCKIFFTRQLAVANLHIASKRKQEET